LSILASNGDVQFRIVDGELHVRSRASMVGYHGEDPIDPDQWRATGDLVEVVGDRVEFRGRRNDIINVGGVKVHPLPVEERVNLVPGVAAARAFGRTNALTGAIVAVELVLEPGYVEDDVDAAVRKACEGLPAAARPRSIRFVESIATTGNKMSRGAR
jgi:acyl-coenzyme A synthetase/AMP-(fatty) acid ligase